MPSIQNNEDIIYNSEHDRYKGSLCSSISSSHNDWNNKATAQNINGVKSASESDVNMNVDPTHSSKGVTLFELFDILFKVQEEKEIENPLL